MKRARGSIITMKDSKRRNKFRVRITVGYKDNGSAIYQNLGCYATKKEAESVLSNYIVDPRDPKLEEMTFEDIYKKWFEIEAKRNSDQRKYVYNLMFEKCKSLHKMKFSDVRDMTIHSVINDMTYSNRKEVKSLFSNMSNFALKNDIIKKDYSQFIEIGKNENKKIERKIFSEEEIDILLHSIDKYEIVDMVLILIYTGFRINEILNMKRENVDLENRILKGGSKTEAGKNRIVPIHHKIYPLVLKRYSSGLERPFFCNFENNKSEYKNFNLKFKKLMKKLGFYSHTIHDCRYTFATRMNDFEANSTSIKTLIGHSSFKMTEKIYTKKSISELRKAIEKME